GMTTITAAAGGLTASVTVNVSAGTLLAVGTMRWSVPPAIGGTWARFIFAHPTVSTGIDLYLLQNHHDGSCQLLPGLEQEGHEMSRWALRLASVFQDPFGDTFGGVTFTGEDLNTFPHRYVMMRAGGTAPDWVYAADLGHAFLSRPAQTYGGVIA